MTIRKLIEAVQAGGEQENWPTTRTEDDAEETHFAEGPIFQALPAGRFDCKQMFDIVRAYNGSLDAAKALHDALLPGWWVQISGPTADMSWMVNFAGYDSAFADDPARAWLLAILRALEATQEPTP